MARDFVLYAINPWKLVGTCFLCGLWLPLHLPNKSNLFNVIWMITYPPSDYHSPFISYMPAIETPHSFLHMPCSFTLCALAHNLPFVRNTPTAIFCASLSFSVQLRYPLHRAAFPGIPPSLNLPTWWSAVAGGISTSHLSVSIYPPYCCQSSLPEMRIPPHFSPA